MHLKTEEPIIGSGKTLEEAEAAASAAGERDPIFEVAPGGRRL
jgi:hypothetical protein